MKIAMISIGDIVTGTVNITVVCFLQLKLKETLNCPSSSQAHRTLSVDSLVIGECQVKNPYSSSFLLTFQNSTEPSSLLMNFTNPPPSGISCLFSVP